MGPEQADQPFGQFRQVVVQLLPQPTHQECKTFEQAFYIRILRPGFIEVQLFRPVRKSVCELLARFAQITHFGVEIAQCQIVHAQGRIPDK
ncbi:hypothetical protein D9M71_369560 [compost metagenome]